MSWGNGFGPLGIGRRSGRNAGFCAGFAAPGYYGCKVGRGRGRGYRRMFFASGLPGWARFGSPTEADVHFESKADEKKFLENQLKFLENRLGEVKNRLKQLEEPED
ncbi:MAG: DUF5320 domain-containing protein [Eubacteriales bacterium]|jgi:hypothetical protein